MSCGSRATQEKPEALPSCSEQKNEAGGDVSLPRTWISTGNPDFGAYGPLNWSWQASGFIS
jgi:hypothetical protein